MSSSLLAVAFLLAQASTPIAPTPDSLEQGVLGSLFKSKNGTWRVENGELIGRAEPDQMAWWRIPGEYNDFEFEAEFSTATPSNGGVQFRAHWLQTLTPAGSDMASDHNMFGYQANIDSTEPGRNGEILIAHGQPPLSKATEESQKSIKADGWNKISIRAVGPVSLVSINGVPAAVSYDETFIGGLIAFQVQGGEKTAEVRYRNIRITNLGRGEEWRSLFDGKSLEGWKIYGTEDFHVKDGIIECRRGPKESEGYLATEEHFSDFRVRGQFKMLGDGNYGLFYHSTITLRENDGYPVIAGVQGEVEPSYPGSTGWVYESYRRGWLIKPDKTVVPAMLLRVGEWNEIEIRSRGNHLTTWVNGMRVLNLVDTAPQLFSGSFALQLHTGEGAGIDWRELYVTNP